MSKKGAVAAAPRVRIKISDAIDAVALSLFSGPAHRIVKAFELDRNIKLAGLGVFPIVYASRMLFITFISSLLTLLFITSIILAEIPFLVKVVIVVFLALVPVLVFVTFLTYPASKIAERRRGVESELPFFATYLATMARGGVPVEKVIEKAAELKIFKAIRREAQRIKRDVELFGLDPLTAMTNLAVNHPSRRFRDLLLGYVMTIRTGGDIVHYLEVRTEELFAAKSEELRIMAERMSLYIELYIAVAVVLTLALYIFFAISTVIPAAGGFGGLSSAIIYSYMVLPLMSVMILYIIDKSQPKTPIPIREPYIYLMVTAPASIILAISLLFLTGGYKIFHGVINLRTLAGINITLALAITALASLPVYSYFGIKRKEKGLNHALASYLRDLAETRKTGLSPEKCIILLGERDYGALTPIARRAATALSLGMNIEKALRMALRGYTNWLLIAVMRFLTDSIEVGGGTPETLDVLAKYTQTLAELEDELKRRLRAFIVMPYFGAILVAVASLLIISLLSQSAAAIGAMQAAGIAGRLQPELIPQVLLVLTTGAIINSALMGVVAGKIQDLTLAAGFFHSIVLVVITLIAIIQVLILYPPVGLLP